MEIVSSHPYHIFGVEGEDAGTTEVYERGSFVGNGFWTIKVCRKGMTKVTVPAGMLTVERWKGTLLMVRTLTEYTIYTAGPVEIKSELVTTVDGQLVAKIRRELKKGPLYRR